MPRPKPEDISSAGQDSFLDVVTNIVGILIILVMLVGGRAKKVIMDAMPARGERVAALEHEVLALDQAVAVAESEVAELAAQGRTVATAAAFAGEARLHLATAVSAAKVEVDRLKQQTDAGKVKAAEAAARRLTAAKRASSAARPPARAEPGRCSRSRSRPVPLSCCSTSAKQ